MARFGLCFTLVSKLGTYFSQKYYLRTYTFPDIIQVIHVLGDHVHDKDLHRVWIAQCFTLIADEVRN